MAGWAEWQGINYRVLLDDPAAPEDFQGAKAGAVTADDIKQAVAGLLQDQTLTQLILYFSGHGVFSRGSHRWLLSGAPHDADEAVDVDAAILKAERGTVPHVVFISDACAALPDDPDSEGICGSAVIAGPSSGQIRDIDKFYAAVRAESALEQPTKTGHRAAFTTYLLHALLEGVPGESDHKVRPAPLLTYLKREVPRGTSPPQRPTGDIQSGADDWISDLQGPGEGDGPRPPRPTPEPLPHLLHSEGGISLGVTQGHPVLDASRLSRELGRVALQGDTNVFVDLLGRASRQISTDTVAELWESFELALTSSPDGPIGGVRVIGADVIEAFDVIRGRRLDVVQNEIATDSPATLVLSFGDDTGAVVPTIADRVATVWRRNGELVEITYDQSGFVESDDAMRGRLLRLVAGWSHRDRLGVLEQLLAETDLSNDVLALAAGDPTLALYAAYAGGASKSDLHALSEGLPFVDLPILEGTLKALPTDSRDRYWGTLPLLTRGWSAMQAFDVDLPAEVRLLPAHVGSRSAWTLLDGAGTAMAVEAFAQAVLA